MDPLGSKIKQITGELREYLETRIDLLSINIGEQVSLWVGITTQKIVGFTIIGCGLFLGCIALAIYLGDVLGHEALGYVAVAAFLLVIGLIFLIAKPFGIASSIQKQIMAGVLKTIDHENPKKLELPEPKEEGRKNE